MILPFNKLTLSRFTEVRDDIFEFMSWYPHVFYNNPGRTSSHIRQLAPPANNTIHWYAVHRILNFVDPQFRINDQQSLRDWEYDYLAHRNPQLIEKQTTRMFKGITYYLDSTLEYLGDAALVVSTAPGMDEYQYIHFANRYFDYAEPLDERVSRQTRETCAWKGYSRLLNRLGITDDQFRKYKRGR